MLARAGVGARRACERAIEEGLVSVNGRVVRELPAFVNPESDRILVDGRPLRPPERLLYVMFHKPTRTLSGTRSLPSEDADDDAVDTRRGVIDMVDHPAGARLIEIAPLDFDATGIVLLSNDGELVNKLTHARYGVPRLLQAVVKGVPDARTIERLRKGVYLPERRERDADITQSQRGWSEDRGPMNKRPLGAMSGAKAGTKPGTKSVRLDVRVIDVTGERTTLEIISRDGRDAHAREVLTIVGFPPKKLTRLAIGPVELSGLGLGRWRELERAEIIALKRAAGKDPRSSKGGSKNAGDGPRAKDERRAAVKPGSRRDGPDGAAGNSRPERSVRVVQEATRKPRVIRPENEHGKR